MSAADGRKRELANFEITAKPVKKGSASSAARSGSKSASTGAKKAASSGAKQATVAKKSSTAAVKKSAASAAAEKSSASAAKKSSTSSAAKKPASASSPAKKSASPAKKSASASSAKPVSGTAKGTKSASAASKKGTGSAKKTQKPMQVQENPLARRDSAVLSAAKPASSAKTGAKRSAAAAVPAAVPAAASVQKKRVQPVRDPYDDYDFDAPVRKKRPPERSVQRKKKKKKKRSSPFSALTLLLLFIIAGAAALGVWRVNEYENFTAMKAVVSRETFYDGTSVEGVDVSGMTLPQALEYWESEVEPAYRNTKAVLNDGTPVTAEQLGYESDAAEVLSAAWNSGRSGSLVERYRRAALHMAEPRAYDVKRVLYDEELVRSYAAQLAEQIDSRPKNASLESFDTATQSFTYQKEQIGRTLDQEKLARDIMAAIEAGGAQVQMEIEAIAPEVTIENVSSQYGMITSAVTNASSSSKNRLNNIALSLQMIDGTRLEPGQTFSFNEVVGQRTKDRGFKSAPAYSKGEVTEEVGGGICQVSTTLFNAAVKSNMEIKERYNHSMTVSYVDPGKDAAVDWGNKDLKFTNTSDDAVYICCRLSDDKRVHIAVYGKLLEDGKSITVEGKKTRTEEPETEYRVNFTLGSGQTKLVQEGKKGCTATTYKIWWDANGNEIEREQLCKSYYNATKEIVEYGP